MHSTLKPDARAIAPDIIPTARADKVLADMTRDAKSHAPDQKPGKESGGALAIDTTFRAAAVGNLQAPREKPPAGKWVKNTIMTFMFALCSATAAAAWQHYGDAAKQMVSNWTPPFTLAASPPDQTVPATQPDAAAVQASAADQTPHPTTSASAQENAASDTAVPSPESSPSIQSMARDLAAMGQQIEQLKADIADLKAGQQSMARDVSKTTEKTSEARTQEAKTSAIKISAQRARQKLSAPPPPLRSAAAHALRPMPAYPPAQAAAALPLPLVAPSAAPPQPAPPPQIEAAPADEAVMRPPLPLR
jgi:hypothetical protein